MDKPLAILEDKDFKLTPEVLPQWQICRDLAIKLNRFIGDISILFESTAWFSCEFRWRDKCIGIIETSLPNGKQFSPRIRASRYHSCTEECMLGPDVPKWLWQNIFCPAIVALIQTEEHELDMTKRKIINLNFS